eukprot:6195620-Pleurochrysis_carterae.AAC.3
MMKAFPNLPARERPQQVCESTGRRQIDQTSFGRCGRKRANCCRTSEGSGAARQEGAQHGKLSDTRSLPWEGRSGRPNSSWARPASHSSLRNRSSRRPSGPVDLVEGCCNHTLHYEQIS